MASHSGTFLQRTLFLFIFSLFIGIGQAAEPIIARLGLVLYDTTLYSDSALTSGVSRISVGQKLVVLSNSSNAARTLQTDGSELFVPMRDIEIGEKVTLKSAMAKVSYFERMRANDPFSTSYFDLQAGPWVALVARYLANSEDAGDLPDVDGSYEGSSTLPSLNVTNSTSYTVRVYLVGPNTVSRVIKPNSTLTETFPSGSYRAVVEATSGNVRPLRTNWKLERGYIHRITLIIRTVRVK